MKRGINDITSPMPPYIGQLLSTGNYAPFHEYLQRNNITTFSFSRFVPAARFYPPFLLSHFIQALKDTNVTKIDLSNFTSYGLSMKKAKNIVQILSLQSPKVTEIVLHSNKIDDKNAADFVRAVHNTNVTHISFAHNTIKAKGAEEIIKASHGSPVTHIDLSDNPIAFQDTESFFKRLRGTALIDINLSNTHLSVESVKYLAAILPSMDTLISIDLSDNKLGTEGAQYIINALPNTNLEKISLAGNNIDAIGAKNFVKALPSTKVDDINLNNNKIGEDPVNTVKNLSLRDTSVTQVGLANNKMKAPEIIRFIKTLNDDTKVDNLDISDSIVLDKSEAKDLRRALENNHSLKTLHLRQYKFAGIPAYHTVAEGIANSTIERLHADPQLQWMVKKIRK